MNYKFQKKLDLFLILIWVLVISLFVIGYADGMVPGSEEDPLITQSYVEQKVEQIKYYIDNSIGAVNSDAKKANAEIEVLKSELLKKNEEIAELNEKIAKLGGSSAAGTKFEVINLKKGQILLAGDGAEIIPRSGKLTAVYGAQGGLSDITSAKDLKAGEAIILNHMLISSRDDGRGVKAATEAYILVKGGYKLK